MTIFSQVPFKFRVFTLYILLSQPKCLYWVKLVTFMVSWWKELIIDKTYTTIILSHLITQVLGLIPRQFILPESTGS